MRDPEFAKRIDAVLSSTPESLGISASAKDERGLPGAAEFRQSGWWEHMLLRYLLALDAARDKLVLDSCSGLGWGSHLLAGVAAGVVGVDLDENAVGISRRNWGDPNASFVQGSVLDLPFEDQSFDVVLCMEAIEHFGRSDGRRFLRELARVTRPGGLLFGSSAFPETRRGADELCSKNEHHLHIYTRAERAELPQGALGRPLRLPHHYFAAGQAPG